MERNEYSYTYEGDEIIVEVPAEAGENTWTKRSDTLHEYTAGGYVGKVAVYGKDAAGSALVKATALAKDGRSLTVQPGACELPLSFASVTAAKRAVIRAILADFRA